MGDSLVIYGTRGIGSSQKPRSQDHAATIVQYIGTELWVLSKKSYLPMVWFLCSAIGYYIVLWMSLEMLSNLAVIFIQSTLCL